MRTEQSWVLLAAFALACVALASAHAHPSANDIAEATQPPPERTGLALAHAQAPAVSTIQTPYFTLVANAIPSMQAVYDTMGGAIVSHIAAVDLSGDGRDDMAIHFWKFAIGSTPGTNVPCINRLVLLIQQPNGTFLDRTSTYLTGAADLGACSLGHQVVDVNGDGRQDVVYSTSQEDGRDPTDPNVGAKV